MSILDNKSYEEPLLKSKTDEQPEQLYEKPLLRSEANVIKLTGTVRRKFLSAKEALKDAQDNPNFFSHNWKIFLRKLQEFEDEFENFINQNKFHQSLPPDELLEFYGDICDIDVASYQEKYKTWKDKEAQAQSDIDNTKENLKFIGYQLNSGVDEKQKPKQDQNVEGTLDLAAEPSPKPELELETEKELEEIDREVDRELEEKSDPPARTETLSNPTESEIMETLQRLDQTLRSFQESGSVPSKNDFQLFALECNKFKETLRVSNDFTNVPPPILEFYKSFYTLKLQLCILEEKKIKAKCLKIEAKLHEAYETSEKYKRTPKVYRSFLSFFRNEPETLEATGAAGLISFGFGPLAGLALTVGYTSLALAALAICDHYQSTHYAGDFLDWLDQHTKLMANIGYGAAGFLFLGLIGILLADRERRAINRKNQISAEENQKLSLPAEKILAQEQPPVNAGSPH